MTRCPSDEKLTGLLSDALSTEEQEALARHVERCTTCRDRLARFTETPDLETWRRAEDPPRASSSEEMMMQRLKRPPWWSAPTASMPAARLAGHSLHAVIRRPGAADAEWPAVPGYEILGELGRGGMGVVYQARQLGLHRTVALKMVLTGIHTGPKDVARFRAEAAVIARLRHPNIVQIYDVGEAAGRPYFVLEYVAGGSLAQHLQGKPQRCAPGGTTGRDPGARRPCRSRQRRDSPRSQAGQHPARDIRSRGSK